MTKIAVDKALIEQAIEAAFSPYCTQDLAILVPALRAALAEPAAEPMRKHVEDFAAKGGWTKGSGEGAFEFVQRISYAQGVEDGRNRSAQTPPAAVPLLSDEEMMEMVTANAGYGGTNFDRVTRAIERAAWPEGRVRRKAGL